MTWDGLILTLRATLRCSKRFHLSRFLCQRGSNESSWQYCPGPRTMSLFERLEWWLEGLLLFVTAVLGLLGNLVFISVFTFNRRNLNTFHGFVIST